MSELDLEMPATFDRLPNGRCRAYWMAHSRCPGGRNRHEYAIENMHRYLAEAKKLDETEGMLPCCKGQARVSPRPVRVRTRAATRKYEAGIKPIPKGGLVDVEA